MEVPIELFKTAGKTTNMDQDFVAQMDTIEEKNTNKIYFCFIECRKAFDQW